MSSRTKHVKRSGYSYKTNEYNKKLYFQGAENRATAKGMAKEHKSLAEKIKEFFKRGKRK